MLPHPKVLTGPVAGDDNDGLNSAWEVNRSCHRPVNHDFGARDSLSQPEDNLRSSTNIDMTNTTLDDHTKCLGLGSTHIR